MTWLFALTSLSWAVDPQYRQVKLVDGRVLLAEILATESRGLRLRVPQGELLVSFELLLDMIPISQQQFDAQSDWVVYYDVPTELQREVSELLEVMDGVYPQPVDVPGNGVDSRMAFAAAACQRDVDCIASAVSPSSWKWVLGIRPSPSGGWMVESKLNTSADVPIRTVLDGAGRNELWEAIHVALQLEPAGSSPRGGGGSPAEPAAPVDAKRVFALSFVPVPGLPSLVQGDLGGFAISLGVVVPSTAAWVAAVGPSSQTNAEFGALSFAGYYAVTVLANRLTGARSLERTRLSTTVVPRQAGGEVVFAGRW